MAFRMFAGYTTIDGNIITILRKKQNKILDIKRWVGWWEG